MENRKRIAPHEAFELHEILTFKNVCLTKSSAMAAFVKDDELAEIMRQDFNISRGQIKEIRDFLQSSELAAHTAARDDSTLNTIS